MSETTETPGFWAVVEIMGHQKYAGFVTRETLAAVPLLRVDVPGVTGETFTSEDYDYSSRSHQRKTWQEPDIPGFTKYFGDASIFCITPCSEEEARAIAKQWRSTPVQSLNKALLDTSPRLIASAPIEEEEEEFDP